MVRFTRGSRRLLVAAVLAAGCGTRTEPPTAGPDLPIRAQGRSRDAAADDSSGSEPAPLPESFEALRSEALALAATTRRRHGDSPEKIGRAHV